MRHKLPASVCFVVFSRLSHATCAWLYFRDQPYCAGALGLVPVLEERFMGSCVQHGCVKGFQFYNAGSVCTVDIYARVYFVVFLEKPILFTVALSSYGVLLLNNKSKSIQFKKHMLLFSLTVVIIFKYLLHAGACLKFLHTITS